MIDFASIIHIGGYVAPIVAFAASLRWLFAGSDGSCLSALFAIPRDPPRPRGVQEEEPVAWRLDALPRRHAPEPPLACREVKGRCIADGAEAPGAV